MQAQLAGQLTDAGHGDHLAIRVLAHADDVVLVFGPLLLVERHHRVGHVDLQSAVLLELVDALQRGGLARRHDDGGQVRAACEDVVLNLGHLRRQGDASQPWTEGEGTGLDAPCAVGQADVAQLLAALEPRGADVVEPYALEVLEVAERADVVVVTELLANPGKALLVANAAQVDVLVPVPGVGNRGRIVVVAHVLQGLAHVLVARLDDAGQEAVLVGAPVGVVLERLHLQRHHAYLRVGVVEHALAYLQHLRCQRLDVVVAVGHQVQRVEVFQVAAVGKAVVLQLNLEIRVAVVSGVQVGEVHILHVRVASEGAAAHVVGLVVVRRADVHGDLQCAVVVVQEVLVGIVHQHVLDGVAVLRALLLDGVLLIHVGVPGAVVVQRAAVLGHGLAILEEPFQRFPRLAGQEVVLARLISNNVEVQRVHVAEDAVASQDEVLRAKAVLAVLLSLQNQVELLQVRAALEGVVGDAADERRRVLARGAARVFVEPYFL